MRLRSTIVAYGVTLSCFRDRVWRETYHREDVENSDNLKINQSERSLTVRQSLCFGMSSWLIDSATWGTFGWARHPNHTRVWWNVFESWVIRVVSDDTVVTSCTHTQLEEEVSYLVDVVDLSLGTGGWVGWFLWWVLGSGWWVGWVGSWGVWLYTLFSRPCGRIFCLDWLDVYYSVNPLSTRIAWYITSYGLYDLQISRVFPTGVSNPKVFFYHMEIVNL